MARRTVDSRPPATRRATPQRRRPSRAILLLLGGSFVVPLGIILALLASDVRLGQGYFAYRYSPVRGLRTTRAIPAVLIGATAAGAVVLLCRRDRRLRAAGGATLAASLAAAGVWIWFAPPAHVNQHMFNMTSPSSDGAFALEAREIESLPAYLSAFPQRLRLTPQQMGGTRILSNPPLTTVFAYAVRGNLPPEKLIETTQPTTRTTTASETSGRAEASGQSAAIATGAADATPVAPPTALERWLVAEHDVLPDHARYIAYALRVGILLTILWILSSVAAYILGRV